MITYKEQFDKLTTAYIAEQVDPYDCEACFVGNLLNRAWKWGIGRKYRSHGQLTLNGEYAVKYASVCIHKQSAGIYSIGDILQIEKAFLIEIEKGLEIEQYSGATGLCYVIAGEALHKVIKKLPDYEDRLFNGFCAALEVLKGIHESKGEVVEPLEFKRRELKKELIHESNN